MRKTKFLDLIQNTQFQTKSKKKKEMLQTKGIFFFLIFFYQFLNPLGLNSKENDDAAENL